jgi:hypothetical protein
MIIAADARFRRSARSTAFAAKRRSDTQAWRRASEVVDDRAATASLTPSPTHSSRAS